MELILPLLLVIFLFAGYSVIQQQRERRLAEQLKKTRDASLIVSQVDTAIGQSKNEAEMFERNSGRRF